MANAYNVCGWVKRVTATMGIPAIFFHDEGAKWGGMGAFWAQWINTGGN